MGACTAVGFKANLVSTASLRSTPFAPGALSRYVRTSPVRPSAPPLSGAPETVTPSDTSMSVRGSGTSMSVCVCAQTNNRDMGVAPVCRCVTVAPVCRRVHRQTTEIRGEGVFSAGTPNRIVGWRT